MNLPFPLSTFGHAAASLYTAGSGIRTWLYHQGWMEQKRLGAKVISIGNITWGGTGKTPFTIWLAQRLSAAGLRASILTRGYGRTSADRVRFFLPGASADDARMDGDEVQLYLRHSVNVPIGIAASRYDAGRTIEERFRVDVHLLDDGFQHLSLDRDLDIVLIDARNPWGARWGLSRVLRESPAALRRAHATLITNCGLLGNGGRIETDSLREKLRTLNPDAPQFLASTRIACFVARDGQSSISPDAMKDRRALVFCGLGSPNNFLATLNAASIPCVAQQTFHDHHRYHMDDLKNLEVLAHRNRADCLITTEKDLVNLPAAAELTIPLYWADIRLVVEEEHQLIRWMGEKLGVGFEHLASSDFVAAQPGGQRVADVAEFRTGQLA
ncbi:MAG: tetraacyldisaccharide 4'-kinase [Acidobacteria bacterium]|nr:tetraacyldisaccharide 4'-kinase [Acidobacteriota bacterium]